MIRVSSRIVGLEKVGPALTGHLRRTLPKAVRQQILLEEAAPVAARMTAVAPRGPHNPHAADFIRATPVEAFNSEEAAVAIGVVDVPGKRDRGFVFGFLEFGTRRMAARPFIRSTTDVELPRMLARVKARVAEALAR